MKRYREVVVQHLLNLSLCMQECGFEFDTSYGNNYQIHFLNNQFINVILRVRVTYIDCRDSVLLTLLVLTLSGAIESVRINGVSVESGLNLEKM